MTAPADGWSAPERIDEVDARSADDPGRVDPYVEHWFWLRAREEAARAEAAARQDAAPPRVPLPWPPEAGGEWPRTVLRGLGLEVLARLREAEALAARREG